MLESEALSILSEINRRRGYLVLACGRRCRIGDIIPGLVIVDAGTRRNFDQPFRITAETDEADFEDQIALSGDGAPPGPVGPFFYRMVTD
jgi:hypothetical protein